VCSVATLNDGRIGLTTDLQGVRAWAGGPLGTLFLTQAHKSVNKIIHLQDRMTQPRNIEEGVRANHSEDFNYLTMCHFGRTSGQRAQLLLNKFTHFFEANLPI
jgi:hypothetical protein